MKFKNLIKKNILVSAAILVLIFISFNTIVLYINDKVKEETTIIRKETERVIFLNGQLWHQVVRNVDIGLRGFALTKDEALLSPYNEGISDYPILTAEIKTLLKKQDFKETIIFDSIMYAVDNFVSEAKYMTDLVKKDSMNLFNEILKQDPGKKIWAIYSRNTEKLVAFEEKINQTAATGYANANRRTFIVQIILLLIGFPTLLFMVFKMRKDKKERLSLFSKLEKNNRTFIFDSGISSENQTEDEVIENSIKNFQKATNFISQISAGNFAVDWDELNESNEKLNKNNLAGELVNMRERMKQIKLDDEKRFWVNEGLSKYSEVLREHQHNLQTLAENVLVFITKYMNAQQGAFFVTREDDEKKNYLELIGCFAFNKKKHLTKRIEIGQGMVGQAFLEKTSNMRTEIPAGYTSITSGLGESTPTCLLIVPMKYNNNVEAVIEIAGFEVYEKYQIEFLEKLGEITASTLGSVKNSEQMHVLLEQFKEQTDMLRAQEEMLRQSMEEMEATEEAVRRKERDS